MGRLLLTVAFCCLASACGGSSAASRPANRPEKAHEGDPEAPPHPVTSHWPETLVVLEGVGPALYADPSPDAPPFGFVSKGTLVRVEGAPSGARIPVKIEGAFEVRGYLDLERLGARVQRRGRIAGTPVYVGANDVVRVLGDAEAGALRVEARPVFLGERRIPLGAYEGSYPAAGLSGSPVPPDRIERPTEGRPARLPTNRSVALHERPGERVVTTLPPFEHGLPVTVLVEEGEWKGIRVGSGPYLVGYVREPLEPGELESSIPDPLERPVSSGALPKRLLAESDRPLFKVPAGTEVRFRDRVIGVLLRDGYAREMERFPENGEVDAFLAIDEDVAVRALVPIDALTPVRP